MRRMLCRRAAIVAIGALLAGLAVVSPPGATRSSAELYLCPEANPLPSEGVTRIAGANRYETAIAISRLNMRSTGICDLHIASGETFPDALAASAGSPAWTPLLLVPQSYLPQSVRREIRRLDPFYIQLFGGRSAISQGVHDDLAGYVGGRVGTHWGLNRYDTAAQATWHLNPRRPVFIASGTNFPDAIAGSPLIGANQGALLLVSKFSIPAETRNALRLLRPTQIIVLGGRGAVSASVQSRLDAYTSGSVTRIAGVDRFATAVAISENYDSDGTVFIVSGTNYPDALALGPLARALRGAILLVERDTIPDVVRQELLRLQPQSIRIVGGVSAVSAEVEAELQQYIVERP